MKCECKERVPRATLVPLDWRVVTKLWQGWPEGGANAWLEAHGNYGLYGPRLDIGAAAKLWRCVTKCGNICQRGEHPMLKTYRVGLKE
jgi:hypothetical protein